MYKPLNEIYHNNKFISLDNKYGISESGEVYSYITNKVMKTYKDPKGYDIIYLKDSNNKKITCKISRLVGFAYLYDTFDKDNKYEINHIDGNKNNNHYNNLEWCDRQYNTKHQFNVVMDRSKVINKVNELSIKRQKKVAMLDKVTNDVIKVFNSINEASLYTNINKTTISDSCNHKRLNNRTLYNWKFV